MVAYFSTGSTTLRLVGRPGRVVRLAARFRRAGWRPCTRGAYYYQRRLTALCRLPLKRTQPRSSYPERG